MNELPTCVHELAELTDSVLQRTEPSHDPLAVLFRTALKEQKAALERLTPEMRDDDLAMEAIKTDLSIVYHDHEIAEVNIRSWVRHLGWAGDPRLQLAREMAALSAEMKKRLERIAALLEERFRHDELKYVIPSFYDKVMR
ncbi:MULTISPECIES: hypothetical protein [Sorangium]|uniref:hypothetical protein n=1 Tax=Sorangium TaxID=39643 RepID=UPI003D9C4C2D